LRLRYATGQPPDGFHSTSRSARVGCVGGTAAGAAANQYSLGTLGNAIAGAVGGGIMGQLIGTFAGQMVEGWVGNIAGGAVGGMILMLLVGVIRNMTQKWLLRPPN
jgi:uncharacterized membrane protein YeaQ/YmgE (transglycosylase-associated protein family)